MMNTPRERRMQEAVTQEQENDLAAEPRYRLGRLIAVMLSFELVALITILQPVSVHA